MNLPHACRPHTSTPRFLALGVATLSTVALVGLGCGTAAAAPSSETSTSSPAPATAGPPAIGKVGTVDPTGYLAVTGATAYASPDTPPLRAVNVATGLQLTAALASAQPGDNIVLSAGTYVGPFTATVSGTLAHPIVVRPAAGAGVTLTASLPAPACSTKGPDPDRTFSFMGGIGHWVLTGLTIDGGVTISSKNANTVQDWQAKQINAHNWQARRAVPGAMSRDVLASRTQEAYLGTLLSTDLFPSQDLQILGNTITRKGIFGRMTSYDVISGNSVTDIQCGTGPAVWLANYSHGNVVSGNFVARVAASTAVHFMQEGIRLGNGSDYNVVVGNRVRDLPAGGRAITTDQDSSWNLFTQNRVNGVDIAFNDQQSGWGNTWSYNLTLNPRISAFSMRMEDIGLSTPSRDSSTYYPVVRCNMVVNSPMDFQAGAVAGGDFESNGFTTWKFNMQLAGYWTAQGNVWNGSTSLPSISSPSTTVGC
ncbi:MAG: hypothetical protein M3Y71_00630 [Actinomycetota bacterium]|nr:hypothetical protein [Actinomycetota bacterium]